jgi:hypothetical protein
MLTSPVIIGCEVEAFDESNLDIKTPLISEESA